VRKKVSKGVKTSNRGRGGSNQRGNIGLLHLGEIEFKERGREKEQGEKMTQKSQRQENANKIVCQRRGETSEKGKKGRWGYRLLDMEEC